MLLTATHFLYEASLKTPDLAQPNGKVIRVHELAQGGEEGECRLCASETTSGFVWSRVSKKTFTDHDICARPESSVVCEFCVWALGWTPGLVVGQGGLSTFRLYSVYATSSGVELPSRARWREVLTAAPQEEYLACIAVSGKKWLHIKSRVERPAEYWSVMLEERRVILHPVVLRRVLADFEALYAGFPKAQIENGEYNPSFISKFGVEAFDRLERRLKVFRGTDLFQVVAFVAQRPEIEEQTREKEERCTTGSRQSAKKSESRLF